MDGVGAEGRKKPKKRVAGKSKKKSLRRPSSLGFIEGSIKRLEEKLKSDAVKGSFSDYFKLLQIRDDMTKEEPKEIRVTWVEPSEKVPATET
jgi:hypothetical protein